MRLVPLAVLVLLTACTSGTAPVARQSPTPRETEQIHGVEAIDRGTVPWEDGVVLDDPRVLRVLTTGLEGPPTPCADSVVVRIVRQTDREVVVEARRYALAQKPTQYDCIGISPSPPRDVQLDAPLAGRRVVDASTGQPREVIAFDDFPTVTQLPPGYQWRPPTWDDGRRVVTRRWGSREGSLTLEIGPRRELSPLPAVLKRGRIRDQEAVVTRVIMLSCLRWGPADRTLNLCSRDAGAGDPPLDADELFAVGRSVS